MKILVLCTGNSCRSQMTEGYLKSLDNNLQVFSAGTHPEKNISQYAVKVMKERGIDISGNSGSRRIVDEDNIPLLGELIHLHEEAGWVLDYPFLSPPNLEYVNLLQAEHQKGCDT